MQKAMSLEAVLFDLDGTLIDTAPDMAYALNLLLEENQRESLAFEAIRPYVSDGSLALVRLGFADLNDAQQEQLKNRYLELYEANLHVYSCLF